MIVKMKGLGSSSATTSVIVRKAGKLGWMRFRNCIAIPSTSLCCNIALTLDGLEDVWSCSMQRNPLLDCPMHQPHPFLPGQRSVEPRISFDSFVGAKNSEKAGVIKVKPHCVALICTWKPVYPRLCSSQPTMCGPSWVGVTSLTAQRPACHGHACSARSIVRL